MSLYSGDKVYNIYINSANRSSIEKTYDFNLHFDNDELVIHQNEGVNVNVVSFSMLNSMYNVNQYSGNNVFTLRNTTLSTNSNMTIPFGNYNVYTFQLQLNALLAGIITVTYNPATNTYTYKNLTTDAYQIIPLNCGKLLGLSSAMSILPSSSITGDYVNMVNYQQVILKCPSLVFENNSMDNIQDKNNFIAVSDILYWINKQDVEPFKMINYKNEDCSTVYSYNVINRQFSTLNFQLVNEFNQPIYDAPDYLLQIQISVFDKDNNYFKEAALQALKLLNDIYFTLLNMISMMVKK
jgi:hypothetical protein